MELLSGGSVADASAMAATVLVEKIMSELAVSADDVAKFVRLQKAMYDSGATPQVLHVHVGFKHPSPQLCSKKSNHTSVICPQTEQLGLKRVDIMFMWVLL